MLPGNRFIITVALNGGMQQNRNGAVVPKQPTELGEAAARCWEAGAALVHVHARGPDGKNSGDPAIYAEIIREIRARCPVLIQTTTVSVSAAIRRPAASSGRATKSGWGCSIFSPLRTCSASPQAQPTSITPKAAISTRHPM